MPTRHRDQLLASCEGRLTFTRHPDGCLLVYPRPIWEAKAKALSGLPAELHYLRRLLVGNAFDVEMDGAGRLLVPAPLREKAGLARDAELLGVGEYFELWEPEQLREREERDLAGGLPPAAAGFSF